MPYANNKGADQPAHPNWCMQSFKVLASFCSWAGWFESYLVENPQRHVFAWCGSYEGKPCSISGSGGWWEITQRETHFQVDRVSAKRQSNFYVWNRLPYLSKLTIRYQILYLLPRPSFTTDKCLKTDWKIFKFWIKEIYLPCFYYVQLFFFLSPYLAALFKGKHWQAYNTFYSFKIHFSRFQLVVWNFTWKAGEHYIYHNSDLFMNCLNHTRKILHVVQEWL